MTPHDFCGLPAWNACPEPSHEETPDEPKWKDILQNNWPVLLKTKAKVMKDRKTEELRVVDIRVTGGASLVAR